MSSSETSFSDRLIALGWVHEPKPEEADDEARALVLRASLLEDVAQGRYEAAVGKAREMALLRGELRDIARHEEARALFGMGLEDEAIGALRLACRASPAPRRSFHHFCLGMALFFARDVEGAINALERARRWAHADRPLVDGAIAWARLSLGKAQPRLAGVVSRLMQSPASEGYGQLVLGMIAHHVGDRPRAATHLRAFLRRNARLSPEKELSLRSELRAARQALASIESL